MSTSVSSSCRHPQIEAVTLIVTGEVVGHICADCLAVPPARQIHRAQVRELSEQIERLQDVLRSLRP